jgi:hypothetical protein
MGRILTFLGVIVLLVGIAGSVWSFLGPFLNPTNTMFNPAADAVQAALDGPKAEDLCEPGETIETEEGSSSRTVGGTWGRPITVYCVDDEGNRREVTGDFANDLLGGALAGIPSFMGGIGLSMCFSTLIAVGVVLLVIGSLITRRSRQQNMVTLGGIPGVQMYTSTERPIANVTTRYVQANPSGGDLTAKLRQLEEAHNKGLISAEEYDRLRQQILDTMG